MRPPAAEQAETALRATVATLLARQLAQMRLVAWLLAAMPLVEPRKPETVAKAVRRPVALDWVVMPRPRSRVTGYKAESPRTPIKPSPLEVMYFR